MTSRNEMIEESDQVAIMELEEELREDKKKPKFLCEYCGKLLRPEEVYEYRGLKLCSRCQLRAKIKDLQARQVEEMVGLSYHFEGIEE